MKIRSAVLVGLVATALLAPALQASTLSEKVYRKLTEIYELREAEKHGEALRETESLLERRLSGHEHTQALLLKVDILLGMERYEDAIATTEQALTTSAVSAARRVHLRYNLGQLYSQVGRWRDAVKILEPWIRVVDEPPANAYFVLAACHTELDSLGDARRWADQGRVAATRLTYSQYQFVASIYAQQSDWRALQTLLEEAVEAFSDRVEFYRQLAQVHLERNREPEALAVLRVAYANGLLKRGEDLVRLAQLMRLQNAPWHAAHIIEEGLDRQLVEPSSRNWLLLGNSWMAAREYERAYLPLRKAAEMTRKPRDWLRLARLYAQTAVWDGCLDSADAGLKTRPADPGPFQLLRGICSYEQGDREDAMEALARAKESKKSAAEANGWIDFIENR